jgi:hypothetical protein
LDASPPGVTVIGKPPVVLADIPEIVIVKIPVSFIVAGKKLATDPAGNPEATKDVETSKPFC